MELSEKYLDDLMVRMAHHSTAIEGNTLTLGETKSILIDGYVPRPMNMRELYEVVNYKAFIPFLTANIDMRTPLSLNFIKSVHAILCKDAIESVPGEFKRIPNQIVGANFSPTPPYLVPSALQDWILNLEAQLQHSDNNNLKVEAICHQHIAFEHIHPFPDGNGRVGRALMVYTCLFMDMPPIVIPVNRKGEYISYLNTEDIRGFTDFALQLQNDESARMRFEFTG